MRTPPSVFHMLVLACCLATAAGLSGLGAELAEAFPRDGDGLCGDECERDDAPGCGVEGTCLCACCPSPAVAPGAPAPVIEESPIAIPAVPGGRCPEQAATPPYHPPR